jgi:hypothetical protein
MISNVLRTKQHHPSGAPSARRRSVLYLAVLLALLVPSSVAAAEKGEEEEEEYEQLGPQAGDFELRLSGDLSHMFRSEMTGFTLAASLGYLVTDWFEIGLSGFVGYSESGGSVQSTKAPLGVEARRYALTVGPVRSMHGDWHGGTDLWLRFFPFAADKTLLPYYLAPFVNIQIGGIFVKDYYPYLILSGSIGLNIYITEQIALSPEFGYSMVRAFDTQIRFDGSTVEHALGFTWGLSFFF